jgi:hypothetical protein
MMSLEAFKFYYWLTFVWGGLGMLFIFLVAVRELIQQVKSSKSKGIKQEKEVIKA